MGISQIFRAHAQEVLRYINRTKITGGCQSERKAAEMISYSKMPLIKKSKHYIAWQYFFHFKSNPKIWDTKKS